MKEKYKTIKVTPAALKNFNMASVVGDKHQWEITEEASKDILKKISDKIKKQK